MHIVNAIDRHISQYRSFQTVTGQLAYGCLVIELPRMIRNLAVTSEVLTFTSTSDGTVSSEGNTTKSRSWPRPSKGGKSSKPRCFLLAKNAANQSIPSTPNVGMDTGKESRLFLTTS